MNKYSSQPMTGDHRVPAQVVPSLALMCPVVRKETLLNAKEMINDTTKSGKQAGAMLVHTEINGEDTDQDLPVYIIVAKGSAPTDPWYTCKTNNIVTPT